MDATFANASFANIEEIGPRLRLIREAKKLPVSTVATAAGMTSIAVTTVEKGSGSIRTVEEIAEALNVEMVVTVADKVYGERHLKLSGLKDFIKVYREAEGLSMNTLGRAAGVQSGSVKVFEASNRPTIKSVRRYLTALNLKLSISLLIDGVPQSSKTAPSVDITAIKSGMKSLETSEEIFENKFVQTIGADLRQRREEVGLTKVDLSRLAKISQLTIARSEANGASLAVMSDMAEALGMKLVITLTDNEDNCVEADPQAVPHLLNAIRKSKQLSTTEMARRIGSTYRSVKIFGEDTASHNYTIERYASALGVTLGHRLEMREKAFAHSN